jgi:tryptophanyl-tRNA synthetase
MLKKALAGKGAKLSAQERAEYEALLDVPASITKSVTSFTTDPAPVEQRRVEVARALVRLTNGD